MELSTSHLEDRVLGGLAWQVCLVCIPFPQKQAGWKLRLFSQPCWWLLDAKNVKRWPIAFARDYGVFFIVPVISETLGRSFHSLSHNPVTIKRGHSPSNRVKRISSYHHFVPAFSAYQYHNLGIAQQIQGFPHRPVQVLDSFHKFIHEASLSPHLNWSSLLFGQDSLSDEVIDHISTGKQYTMLEFSVFSAVPAQILIPCIYWLLHSVLPN